jgi:Cys-tRNA(Pro)/Cys-tRNA(Cys) deacylase
MADKADAARLTGYVLGGISPFGTKKALPVVVDETFLLCDRVHFSGGRRGLEIAMAPDPFAAALSAIPADIQA